MKALTIFMLYVVAYMFQYVIVFGIVYHGYVSDVPTNIYAAGLYWGLTFAIAVFAWVAYKHLVAVLAMAVKTLFRL